jgi:hypothetical protein
MILEKAVAKILDAYKHINALSFGQLFKVLTGCQYFEFKDIDPEKLCKILK